MGMPNVVFPLLGSICPRQRTAKHSVTINCHARMPKQNSLLAAATAAMGLGPNNAVAAAVAAATATVQHTLKQWRIHWHAFLT